MRNYSWEDNDARDSDFPLTFKSYFDGKWYMKHSFVNEVGRVVHEDIEIEDMDYVKFLERTRKGTDKYYAM